MKHCLYFEPAPGGTSIQLMYPMCRPLSHAGITYLQAKADQRKKITVSASHSQPCQLSSASCSQCKASGPTFLALQLGSRQRLRCYKCCHSQGIAPLKPTRTSHRPWRKQASALQSQWEALERSSGGVSG